MCAPRTAMGIGILRNLGDTNTDSHRIVLDKIHPCLAVIAASTGQHWETVLNHWLSSRKAQQRLVDTESRLFGGGVGATHPFVLTLLAACVGLHFYNADLQTKREEEEELLERLRARRRARPLSADELDHALARKRRLLDAGAGDAADAARLSEEISRLEAERRNV